MHSFAVEDKFLLHLVAINVYVFVQVCFADEHSNAILYSKMAL